MPLRERAGARESLDSLLRRKAVVRRWLARRYRRREDAQRGEAPEREVMTQKAGGGVVERAARIIDNHSSVVPYGVAVALLNAGLLGPALSEMDRRDLRLGRLVRGMRKAGSGRSLTVYFGGEWTLEGPDEPTTEGANWGVWGKAKTPEAALRAALLASRQKEKKSTPAQSKNRGDR